MNKGARTLVHLVFFYTCIEGLVINIWTPAKLPYIYKDFAIIAVYIMLFLPNLGRLFSPSRSANELTAPVLFFSLVMAIYLILFGTGLFVGLVALKQRLLYIPLISVGYFFLRSEDDLKGLLSMLSLYAVGVAAFGVYLYFTGPDGLRQLGAYYSAELYTSDYLLTTEKYWRVPGTFTSPGQYGAYLLFNGLIAVALLMTRAVLKPWKRIAAVSLILTILAMLVSGSRAPFVLLTGSVAILLLLSRKVGRFAAWGLVGYAALAFAFGFLGPGLKDRFASIAAYEHFERFQRTYFGQLFLPTLLENPLGSGLGVATIGARHFSQFREIELVESYLGILAVETGVLGLGTFIWLAIAIGALILRVRRYVLGLPAIELWHALAVYVLFTILILPVSTAIDHAPSNLYFWFSIGVLIKLADLEQRKRGAERAAGRRYAPLSSRALQ